MNKKLLEMLNAINAKKQEVKDLIAADKLDEAKAAKNELVNLQNKFDLAKDLYDEEEKTATNNAQPATPVVEDKAKQHEAFVNIIKAGLSKQAVNEEDLKIYNAMTEADPVAGISEGGVTVPQDIRTQIMEMRRNLDALEPLVHVEPVTTLTGSRVIEVTADQVPFDNVDEAAQFPDVATPEFTTIEYKVAKKGGILKSSRELLQDTAENILAYLGNWIQKKARVTRNFMILSQLNTITAGKEVTIADFDDFKDVFNVILDPAIAISSVVLTNQDGFNWMDKQKDSEGNYILQKDPTQATRKLLFGIYPVHVVSNKVLPSVAVGDPVTSHTVPVYMGDFKEAITIFDRETLSIEISTEAGDLWGKDQTGIKVRERLDIKTVDGEAAVKGQISIPVA
ncbi:phage major capsid protein [Sporolactobacillus kofuensis]|uniref:Phage major capsid protein n=1 Tax=Sporolactobacillus kofuensis TaxID=269672 RepID=A0ABW1WDC7_9BACL|nr:phage major capsid protein [Sporolactobacillus kofuensis]MCO7175554.1 phage major capsid protein [Sporolactobacillus kofuensis]